MNNVKIIHDQKFKNTIISVRFLSPLDESKVMSKILLANLLNDVCAKYDTKQKVSNHLDKMYGSSFSVTSNIIGNAQVIIAKVKSIHADYIHGKINLLEEQFRLLNEFLLHPLMKQQSFLKERLDEAKSVQSAYMKRSLDDPSTFCMLEALKVAGEGQPLGKGVNPSYEAIEKVSLDDVNDEYQALLNDYQVDILVFGNVDEKEVKELCERYLPTFNRVQKENVKVNYTLAYQEKEKRYYGYRNITQSYITSIYTTSISNDDPDFKALRVANAIFGQLPSSLLFQNVREKNSLCYSIYSAINAYDGIIGVSTGVDHVNIDKTLQLIEEQYQCMRDGNFEDELIEVSKKMIVNSLLSSNDDMDSILALEYRNILLKQKENLSQVIAGIQSVSKQDIIRVMQKCQYVTSYIVTAKEGDINE
ncbi:MAG: insulinase family protein [Erysipelotrichia bacterium]|nr:insulinase family protein [Erysipelotrichia bacterium]